METTAETKVFVWFLGPRGGITTVGVGDLDTATLLGEVFRSDGTAVAWDIFDSQTRKHLRGSPATKTKP